MDEYLSRLDVKILRAILDEEFQLSKLLSMSNVIDIDLNSKDTLVKLIKSIIDEKMITEKYYLIALASKLNDKEMADLSNIIFGEIHARHSFFSKIESIKLNKRTIISLLDFFGIKQESKVVNDAIENVLYGPKNRFYELLDYQFIVKEQVLSILKDNLILPRMIIHMPTGTGKTKTTVHTIIHNYIFNENKKGCMLWLAHTNELLDQAYSAFKTTWASIGKETIQVIYNDLTDLIFDNTIYFLSYQKLISTFKRNKNTFDLLRGNVVSIVADEAHKCLAKETRITVENLMKSFKNEKNKVLIGLTATPGRKLSYFDDNDENQLLSEMFDKRIISINPRIIESIKLSNKFILSENYNDVDEQDKQTIRYFQDQKILSSIVRKELAYNQNDNLTKSALSNASKSRKGDYDYKFLDTVSTLSERNLVIIEELLLLHEQKIPVILFACSVKHGKFLENVMKFFNVDARGVYGETDISKRKQTISEFNKGVFNILINFEVLATGFDSPRIKAVFITRPTNSIVLYSQMLGRGLRGRKMGGNDSCLLIDLKDNLDKFSNEEEAFHYFEEYWRS